MNLSESARSGAASEDLAELIHTLVEAERNIREITAGEVDAVIDEHGRTFLLQHAQESSRYRECLRQVAVLNALPANIALLDAEGGIVSTNDSWRNFADQNATHAQSPGAAIGLNYLSICDNARGEGSSEACRAAAGIRSVIRGECDRFVLEYPCHAPTQQRWFLMQVAPLQNGATPGAIVLHLDITDRILAENALQQSAEEFRSLAESMPQIVWATRADGWITYFNQRWMEYTGMRLEDSLGNGWSEPCHPDDRQRARDAWQHATATIDTYSLESRLRRADGIYRWWLVRGVPLKDADGSILKWFGTCTDIHDLKESQLEIERGNVVLVENAKRIDNLNRMYSVLSGVSQLIVRTSNRDELFMQACRIVVDKGNFQAAWIGIVDRAQMRIVPVAASGMKPDFLAAGKQEFPLSGNLRAVPAMPTRAIREKKPVLANEIDNPKELFGLSCAGGAAKGVFPLIVSGQAIGVFVLYSNQSGIFVGEELALLEELTSDVAFAVDHIEKSERINYLAYYDGLTALPNATLFNDRMGRLLEAARQRAEVVCAVALDLERFGAVNESFGRAAGDELLRQIAERFAKAMTEPFALGRLGADRFVAASPVVRMASNELRDRLRIALDTPFHIDGNAIRVRARQGIAYFPADGDDADSVIRNAEAALKVAKVEGRHEAFHSSKISAQMAQLRLMEDQLRDAFEARQFVVHYQPRVDMISGEISGAEALIRWHHPERGLLPPGEFIALAEKTGLIIQLGAWVIDVVCAQQAAWLGIGLDVVPVAANLSSIQLAEGNLIEVVRAVLAKHALEARYLELELTESAAMADPAAAANTLRELRKLGVTLALDDFGTGYSSLAYLQRLPFDLVKIDQVFVNNVTHNASDAAIADMIIAMTHRLGRKVVAEGVESQGQFNYLRAQGCDQMQGHLFSPAIPASEFQALLQSRRRIHLPATAPESERVLLLVDDEPGICSALTRMLRRDGYRILTAGGGLEGLEVLAVNPVQVIISDQRMPGMTGTEFLNIVKQLYPNTVRIILSGYTDLQVVTDSVNRGAVFKFLTKPWDDELLREQVRDAFRRHQPKSRH